MLADRDVEKTYPVSEFVAKLRRLADALERNTPFSIQVDGEGIVVPRDAILSVEHEREDGIEELEFQLSWKNEAQVDEAGDHAAEESDELEDNSDDDDEVSEEPTEKSATAA